MSNVLAVATVTEALCQYLARSLQPEIPFGVDVVARKPPADPPPDPMISVFLYQVTPNPALRNRDAPTRAADGTVLTKPQAAIDLHYLISFFGDESLLIPQRLLGCVVRGLHEEPVLSHEDIEAAAGRPYLAGSDLAAAPQRVRFTPAQLDLDDLSKVWSMLFQTPYALSVAYQASVVLLDGRATPVAGKPVLRRNVLAEPFARPTIDRVLSVPSGAGPGNPPSEDPVTKDRDLVLVGANLGRPGLTALVGGEPATVLRASDDQVVLAQPADLPPGVRTVQLHHPVEFGDPPVAHRGLESNVLPYVRRARVLAASQRPAAPDGTEVAVRLDIPVRVDQRVVLLLDEHEATVDARSYQFDAPFPLADGSDPVTEFAVPVRGVVPGVYLVRVQVDGAQSPLEVSNGRFSGPTVELAD